MALQPWDTTSYSKGRPVIPVKVMEVVLQYMGRKENQQKRGVAVDVGCGSGQGTVIISRYFEREKLEYFRHHCPILHNIFISVYGVDNNVGQIEAANKKSHPENVFYKVSSGEVLDFASCSVDLVICCTSYHWMDHPIFLKEVTRVLSPEGVLAVMAIEHPEHPIHLPQHTSNKLIHIQENFFSQVVPYFAPQVLAYLSKYESFFPLPSFRKCEYHPALTEEWRTDLRTQIENLTSSSGYVNMMEVRPEAARKVLKDVTEGFKEAMGGGDRALEEHVSFLVKAFMIIGRK